jgi:molybdopterin-guanine dinucleotide biosynthesis protein A
MPTISAAILAGGQSRRMGTDKSFILLEGRPILEHVLSHVRTLELPTILITNSPQQYSAYNLPIYTDILPGQGSLGGLYTAIQRSAADFTLCVACDMPFLNTALLRYLLGLCSTDWDVIVPRIGGNLEAMHAIYNKTCLEPIQNQIVAGNLKASGFFDKVNVRYVEEDEIRQFDPALRSFINLNTPDDLAAVDALNQG